MKKKVGGGRNTWLSHDEDVNFHECGCDGSFESETRPRLGEHMLGL